MPLFITSVTRAPRYRPRPISFPQIAAHRYPSNVWDQGWEPVRDLETLSIHFPPSLLLFPLFSWSKMPCTSLFLYLRLSLDLECSFSPSLFLLLYFSVSFSLFPLVSWLSRGLRKTWLICKRMEEILFSVSATGQIFTRLGYMRGYNGVIRIKVWSRGQKAVIILVTWV